MRVLLLLALGSVTAACDSGPATTTVPATVYWMEWPAQVLAATPFTVRLIGASAECREILHFDAKPAVDQSAVTFEPTFLVSERQVPCPLYERRDIASPLPPYFDTRAQVPGLTPPLPQLFEIRGATQSLQPWQEDVVPPLIIRTFGDIEVRSDTASAAVTRAGGLAYAYRDSVGCYALFALGAGAGYVLENPPDTASYWLAFVRGYIHTPAVPVCGETKVFHLVDRN